MTLQVPNGVLFNSGVEWYAEGRTATRAEVEASIQGELPTLRAVAELERGKKWLPTK